MQGISVRRALSSSLGVGFRGRGREFRAPRAGSHSEAEFSFSSCGSDARARFTAGVFRARRVDVPKRTMIIPQR